MQRARVSNHPCHRLSVPAAKRFWCRHCMMVFEDAITRWRHSRSCRSGGFDNFVRRREIETQALQKMAETLDPEMVTQVPVHSSESGAGSSKELCCFICRQRFVSLDEMREHVKYPCNKPVSLQRPSMTVYIEEPTFGTGIQQHYTESPASSQPHPLGEQGSSTAPAASSAENPHPVSVYMNESEQGHQDNEAKPTNIYVNEQGETVIEVENLDLNTKSGELSLAHLLTQLSQQGIVFDHQPQGEAEVSTSQHVVHETPAPETDYSQPTAVDAANTLTQLAGSVYRAASNPQETYAYPPPIKRIKTEGGEFQYPLEQPAEHMQVQTYIQKSEPVDEPVQEKYIICTNESEVISVVRADNTSPENSNNGIMYQNGAVSVHGEGEASSIQTATGEAIMFESQSNHGSQTVTVHGSENGTGHNFASAQMMVLQPDQVQIHTQPTGQLVKSEDPSGQQLVITTHNPMEFDQTGQTAVVSHYPNEESTLAVIQSEVINQEHSDKVSLIVETSSLEAGSALTAGSVNAVSADLVPGSEEPASQAGLAEYVAEPDSQTSQAECVTVTEPVSQVATVDYVADPVSQTAQADSVSDSVSQTAHIDFVTEPVSQTAQADCASDPVSQSSQVDCFVESISQTAQVDCVAEPVSQTAQVDCFTEPAGQTVHIDCVAESASQPAQVECVEPIRPATEGDFVAEPEVQLPQMVTVTSSTLQEPQIIVQQPDHHEQGSAEENCLISDGRTLNKKCKKMVEVTKQPTSESQKWLHERIVTRSVSVNLQSQKTRVLRSRSLPTFDNENCMRRKIAIKGSCLLTENVKPSLGQNCEGLLLIETNKRPSLNCFNMQTELAMKGTILSENPGKKQKHKMTCVESKEESKLNDVQRNDSIKQYQQADVKVKHENKQIGPHSNGKQVDSDKEKCCILLQKKGANEAKRRVFKCIVCDVIFNNARLLRRHRQVPCRVKHTRTMSQKVLRPRPSIMCQTSVKDNPLKVHSRRSVFPDLKLSKDSYKPRLLLAPLLLHSKSSLSRIKVSNKKRLFFPLRVPPLTLGPKEESICLQGKRLLFSTLFGKELHMAKLGLVSTTHMTSSALLQHQTLLCSKVAISKRRQQEASSRHFPRSRASLPQSYNTLSVTREADASLESGGTYPSPPVLEPVDLAAEFDVSSPLYSDPPHLEPMVFLPCTETTELDCCTPVCSQPPQLDPMFFLPCVGSDLDPPCAARCSQLFNSQTNGFDNNGDGDYRTVPLVQKSSSPSPFNPFARITIKSLQSGLRLCEGGEIIIKTSCHKDRILLINPD